MPKVPESPKPFEPSSPNKMFICWQPGTTEAEKQEAMVDIEKYMEFRKARAKRNRTKPVQKD